MYTFKKKSEVCITIKKYIKTVKRVNSFEVEILGSDNKTKYVNTEGTSLE